MAGQSKTAERQLKGSGTAQGACRHAGGTAQPARAASECLPGNRPSRGCGTCGATRGEGAVLAAEAVDTQGNGAVLVTEAVGTRGSGDTRQRPRRHLKCKAMAVSHFRISRSSSSARNQNAFSSRSGCLRKTISIMAEVIGAVMIEIVYICCMDYGLVGYDYHQA